MKLYEVTAHIFEHGNLIKAVRQEVEAETQVRAFDEVFERLKGEYPGKTISVTSEEICP